MSHITHDEGLDPEDNDLEETMGRDILLEDGHFLWKSLSLARALTPYLHFQEKGTVFVVSLEEVMAVLPLILVNRSAAMQPLLDFLEEEIRSVQKEFEVLRAEGLVKSHFIPFLFKEGDEVVAMYHGSEICGVVAKTVLAYRGYRVQISCDFVHPNEGELGFSPAIHEEYILGWKGTKPLSSLTVQPLSEETKERVSLRGGRLQEMFRTSPVHYLESTACVEGERGSLCGRVMVDPLNSEGEYSDLAVTNHEHHIVAEGDLWKVNPLVGAFFFKTKKWGWVDVSFLREVSFDKSILENLILPVIPGLDTAHILMSVITQPRPPSLVPGKGTGMTILLHGAPGTGKTATAEAIAEVSQKPLYIVSSGELGTDPRMIEAELGKTFRLVERWGAILLLDEADVFLESRGGDIFRNTIVGVFLRTLEYHKGVIILTSNRAMEFDTAFLSRISLALSYPDLSTKAMGRVWENLLRRAEIPTVSLDIPRLAEVGLNGREISQSIIVGSAIAKAEHRPVTTEDLLVAIFLKSDFHKG